MYIYIYYVHYMYVIYIYIYVCVCVRKYIYTHTYIHQVNHLLFGESRRFRGARTLRHFPCEHLTCAGMHMRVCVRLRECVHVYMCT